MKICIVKTSSLGDIVQTFPVLHYLRHKFPSAKIHWVVEASCASLVAAHPDVDKVICIDTKRWRRGLFLSSTRKEMSLVVKRLREQKYDYLLDLQGNTKSAVVTSVAHAKVKVGFGKESVAEWPNLFATTHRYNPEKGKNIREDYLCIAQRAFEDPVEPVEGLIKLRVSDEERVAVDAIVGNGPDFTLVFPGSAWENKRLTPEQLSSFLRCMAQDSPGIKFLLAWGNDDERGVCEKIRRDFPKSSQIIDKLSLPALQNLMWQVQRVVAMDSLPLHLAGTTEVETVAFFGPSSVQKYAPQGAMHKSYQGTCPYGVNFDKRCPKLRTCQSGACIKNVDIEHVYQTMFEE